MDRKTTVIREEMTQTLVELDQKLARLEVHARTWRPSSLVSRYLPDYPVDRAVGVLLTFIGASLAWRHYRNEFGRRAQIRAAFAAYGRW